MSALLPSEQDLLDRLLVVVLQDPEVQARLLCHDKNLQEEFQIPAYTWQHLCQIRANNLGDFCRQLRGLTCRKD